MKYEEIVEYRPELSENFDQPTLLFEKGDHKLYWLGIPEETAFRCNSYLIVDGDEAVLLDPGNRNYFAFVYQRVSQVINPHKVRFLICCHQDPDVSASIFDWLRWNPGLKIMSSRRANILLLHYGIEDETSLVDIEPNLTFSFSSGRKLRFIEAPFLHFPGAFATYDSELELLFSGDVWAALDIDWRLFVTDFSYHAMKLNLFHIDYMATNVATRGFATKLDGLPIRAILPQHGSIIPAEFVPQALEYLKNLKCGLDLIYPEIWQNH